MSTIENIPDRQGIFQGREIVVGVCGGIAAYKVADVVSKLVQSGAGVTVCMTAEAQRFITPLTLEALSGRAVRTQMFDLMDSSDPQHIGLTERADLLLVAPATAHNLAKAAHGMCDDLISLLICASACPVLFAPAMNNRMWENPITRQNVKKLRDAGHFFIGPEDGWLACRNVGPGRMSEPGTILEAVAGMLAERGPATTQNPSANPSAKIP
ncbi:MAG: phosphopantothenoylcysteine decarboxylase [Phycisphaerales bacterium]|nr:phosphopantothenoylcysteine decarboxylase [Phycisphaerales bacterium]